MLFTVEIDRNTFSIHQQCERATKVTLHCTTVKLYNDLFTCVDHGATAAEKEMMLIKQSIQPTRFNMLPFVMNSLKLMVNTTDATMIPTMLNIVIPQSGYKSV
ncbi:MAG: hypothetical protein [Caudoviricetes sp.]|nr:MAG: hypothetical protein [Caudoviricetes sp.]